jgi:alkaline phosphatase D
MKKIIIFIVLCCQLATWAQIPNAQFRSAVMPELEPFYHGVASGDPTPHSVVLWTRVTPPSENYGSIDVRWKIATDTAFLNTVNGGIVSTDSSRDYTVKIDATDLKPNTWYYYEFTALGKNSLTGRTKTTPEGGVDQLRFAVMSCSNYQAGIFNSYQDVALRNDVDAILHLGDYIYEYGNSIGGHRDADPSTEIYSLADYRLRHSCHKLDSMSIRMHQQYPLIATWDDHEVANNAFETGAENHTPSEGNYMERKSASQEAYYEWMPLRYPEEGNHGKIYRKITFGDLADIFVLDTRHFRRDSQNVNLRNDTSHHILGVEQLQWLKDELLNSQAQWKIIAQQVMMGQLTPLGLVINPDQWDGYAAERKNLYDFIREHNIDNVVVLTGDIHTAWAMDLPYNLNNYKPATGEGSLAVEFVCTSVTSGSSPIPLPPIYNLIENLLLPHIKYVDLNKKGYSLLNLQPDKATGHFYSVKNIGINTTEQKFEEAWSTKHEANHLIKERNEIVSIFPLQQQAPLDPRGIITTPIRNNVVTDIILGAYPNPFTDYFAVQFNLFDNVNTLQYQIIDMQGRVLKSSLLSNKLKGLHYEEINASDLPAGNYIFKLTSDKGIAAVRISKQ